MNEPSTNPTLTQLSYENPFQSSRTIRVEEGEGWVILRRPCRRPIKSAVGFQMLVAPVLIAAIAGLVLAAVGSVAASGMWPFPLGTFCAFAIWGCSRLSGSSYTIRADRAHLELEERTPSGRRRRWRVDKDELSAITLNRLPLALPPTIWIEVELKDGSRKPLLPVDHPGEGAWAIDLLKRGLGETIGEAAPTMGANPDV